MRSFPLPRGGTVTPTPPAVFAWRSQVQQAVVEVVKRRELEPLEGPLALDVTFDLARPAGHFGTGANAQQLRPSAPPYPIGRVGDLDKFVRCVADACTDGGLWRDDAQLVEINARKLYVGFGAQLPGVLITVERLP
jgi:Holliday junction resolvase RusA-like endonuclease